MAELMSKSTAAMIEDARAHMMETVTDAGLTIKDFPKGAVVFREGEPGDFAYLILEGQLQVNVRAPDGRQVVLAMLKAGDLVGEMALLASGVRTATVVTEQPARCALIGAADMEAAIAATPPTVRVLLGALVGRVRMTSLIASAYAGMAAGN